MYVSFSSFYGASRCLSGVSLLSVRLYSCLILFSRCGLFCVYTKCLFFLYSRLILLSVYMSQDGASRSGLVCVVSLILFFHTGVSFSSGLVCVVLLSHSLLSGMEPVAVAWSCVVSVCLSVCSILLSHSLLSILLSHSLSFSCLILFFLYSCLCGLCLSILLSHSQSLSILLYHSLSVYRDGASRCIILFFLYSCLILFFLYSCLILFFL